MNAHTRTLLTAPLLAALACGAALGADVDEVELGAHIHGEALPEVLAHHVVVVVDWTSDPRDHRSRELLQRLSTLHGELGSADELVLIANHTGPVAEADVRRYCQQSSFPFTVLHAHWETPRSGPARVYAQLGALIYEGAADGGLSSAVREALEGTLGAGLEQAKVQRIAAEALATGDYGRQLAALERLAGKADEAERAEAELLSARILSTGEALLADAEEQLLESAVCGRKALEELEERFARSAFGERIEARLQELKEDDAFQHELKADKILQKLYVHWVAMRACEACGGPVEGAESFATADLGCEGCRRLNKRAVRAIEKGAAKLARRYPETTAARKGAELVSGEVAAD